MAWKNLSYWFKWGIIFALIGIGVGLIGGLCQFLTSGEEAIMCLFPLTPIILLSYLLIGIDKLGDIGFSVVISMTLVLTILMFIIGSFIGLIIGKIKNKGKDGR